MAAGKPEAAIRPAADQCRLGPPDPKDVLAVEPFFVILGVAFIVIMIVVGVAVQSHQSSALNDAFAQVARRYDGALRPGNLFQRPAVDFHYQGARATVDTASTGGEHPTYYTQLSIGWPDRELRCEVYPERFMNRLGKMLGMQDISIGSSRFDEIYMITGNNVAGIRELLTPTVQVQIGALRQLLGNDDIYVGLQSGRMVVKKKQLIRDAGRLQEFVRMSLALFDELLTSKAAGIQFVNRSVAPAAEAYICQICGETIDSEIIYCRSCKTPHHHDCWQYFGACSTYGCGDKRFSRP